MEYRLSRMETTTIFNIFFRKVEFLTTFSSTFIFSVFFEYFFFNFSFLFSLFGFFYVFLFVEIGYFFNFDFFFVFILSFSSIGYSIRFVKGILSLGGFVRIYITVGSYGTGGNSFKFIPIIYNFITTGPSFF